jgi:hypothetical protein
MAGVALGVGNEAKRFDNELLGVPNDLRHARRTIVKALMQGPAPTEF